MKLWRATISYKERKTAAGASLLFATKLSGAAAFSEFSCYFFLFALTRRSYLSLDRELRAAPPRGMYYCREQPLAICITRPADELNIYQAKREKKERRRRVYFFALFFCLFIWRAFPRLNGEFAAAQRVAERDPRA